MGVNQFGELGEDLHYLIGTLTTGCDDYDVGLGLLGDGVLKHGLTCTEGAGDESCTTLYDGVEGINGADTCLQQLEGTGLLGIVGHGKLNGPVLYHIHIDVVALLIGKRGNGIMDLVLAGRGDVLDGGYALQLEGGHDLQGLMILLDTT